MVIIIPSYNNMKWYQWNLDSIYSQNYSNYRVIYLDDCSPDGTGKAVEEYMNSHGNSNGCMDRTTLYLNQERVGALANIYFAITSLDPHDIIVLVDGDDALAHPNVLKQLNEVYSTEEVWYTHGCLMEWPQGNVTWSEPVTQDALNRNAFREYKCPTHLRTFYTWLFRKIKLHDLLYKGEFLKMTWDMAIMFPIAEMASERHKYISEVNYFYNMSNPINDNKVDADLQNFLDRLIRNRPRYTRLEKGE